MKTNEVSIKYLGGISDKEKGLSLTGSSTLMTALLGGQKVKILTDIGMFQGGINCDEYNKKIDEEIINCDYVIITHAHMDHIGRLPLLVKNGFKGRILMTGITKELMTPMLNDYVTLTTNKIKEQEEKKKTKGQQLREKLRIVNLSEDETTIKSSNKVEISSVGLYKNYKYEISKIIHQIESFLAINGINNQEDITNFLSDGTYNTYTQSEIDSLFGIIETDKMDDIDEKKVIDGIKNNISYKDVDYVLINKSNFSDIYNFKRLLNSGFSGKILMTEARKNMLNIFLDSFIKRGNKKPQVNKLEIKLSEYLSILESYKSIEASKINNPKIVKEIDNIIKTLNNKFGLNINKNINQDTIEIAKIELAKNNILKEADIGNLQNNLPSIELLYDENDIKKTQSLVSVLEIGDNLDLDTRITISDINDGIIDKIPEMIMGGYNKKIYVLPHVKQQIVSKWNKNFNPEGIISQLEKNEGEKLDNIFSNLKNALNIINENNLEEITETILDKNSLDKRQQIRSNLFYINHLEGKKINLFNENDLSYNLDLLQKGDNAIVINSSQKRIFVNFLKQKVENYSYFESLLIEVDENFSSNEIVYFDENIEGNLTNFKKSNVLLVDSEKEDEFNQFLNNFFIDKNQTKKRKRKNLEKFGNEIEETKSFEKEILILRQYNILNETDLENFIKSEKEKIGLIRKNFSKKEYIENFSSFLEPVFTKGHEKIIDSFKLRFFDAGHIEGSVQAVVTIVTKQVEHTLNQSSFNGNYKREHKNFLFTGDLGKFTQANLSGSPEIPEYKFDYVQIESTYADRNHPDKDEEFKILLNELNGSLGKVVIAAFSLQRTQEIIVELLKNKAENKDSYPEFKTWKKTIKLLKDRFLELGKIENPTEIQLSEKLRLTSLINQINDNITEVQKNLFTGNIILDSPLGTKITNIFTKSTKLKYDLLLKEVQEEIFGKEIVRILEKGEYKEIYKDDRIKSKDIIISSGGMLQGGSIMNHIKNMIDDPNAKIIFTGYQAEGTLGHDILSGKKQIIIEGKVYDVKCKIVQIKGYSSHIGKDDIIKYTTQDLKYSKKAKLSLVHGDETRENIAKDIRKIVKGNIEVLVPKLWDEIKIKI
ncbi:MAG: MBL fold metallo-hydrolase [Candidatus Gracilibacteria bacterium]|nr:MBL fold metallo-hydrolase [Candidatus Gracilibacteria bacterium]